MDQGCHHQNEWEGRFCDGGEGPGVWHDQCAPQDPEEDTYFIEGNCPPGEQCGEYTDRDGDSQVDCITVPTTPDRNDVITKKLQVGKRSFNSVGTKKSKRHKVGIKIGQNYPGASVSAQVMDTKLSFAIETSVDISANLRGHTDIRCQELMHSSRTCNPTGWENLKKGDYLDFTFETQTYQVGWLVYQIYSGA